MSATSIPVNVTVPRPGDVLVETAQLLCAQLKRIEIRHRAGIERGFGELQDLFETRALLERQVDVAAPARPASCAVAGCPFIGVEEVQPGFRHCVVHAGEVRQILRESARLRIHLPDVAAVAGARA